MHPMAKILLIAPVACLAFAFLLGVLMQSKMKRNSIKNPDSYEIKTKMIKKKASYFSIASVILFFIAVLSYLASIWLFLFLSILCIFSLGSAVYYFIFEEEFEVKEYHRKREKDGIKILY